MVFDSDDSPSDRLRSSRILQELGDRDLAPVRDGFAQLGIALSDQELRRLVLTAQTHADVDLHADALVRLPSTVSPAVARGVQVTENATRAIEAEFGLLSSSEVAVRLGSKGAHRAIASDLRKQGRLLALRRLNSFVYPGFQFDPRSERVRPVVEPLLRIARELDWDVEDVVLWMCAPTTYLRGDRPVDRIDDPELLLETARTAWGVEW